MLENQTANLPNMDDLRYPIGRFVYQEDVTADDIDHWIVDVTQLPKAVAKAIDGLSQDQLNAPYRPEGWSLREVVHHLADAHMNAYIRFKLAITENRPTIKPFQENLWVLLSDYDSVSALTSVKLIDALHERWTALLRTMTLPDFQRVFIHPENGETSLSKALQMYAWHGRHHVAHITSLRERNRW